MAEKIKVDDDLPRLKKKTVSAGFHLNLISSVSGSNRTARLRRGPKTLIQEVEITSVGYFLGLFSFAAGSYELKWR